MLGKSRRCTWGCEARLGAVCARRVGEGGARARGSRAHLERVEHPFARDDDLLRLLLHGQGANQRRALLRRLPLGELAEALLAGPHRRVDDLEEELARARVEDEDGAVDRLRRQVALERLMNGHAVDVRVVHEPDDLVREELAVVLRGEVRLRRLGGVELQPLANPLAQHVQRRVRLHDLRHRLRCERLHPGDVVAVRRVQVVREVQADHEAGRRRVDGHVVGCVVKELGARVPAAARGGGDGRGVGEGAGGEVAARALGSAEAHRSMSCES